MGKEGEATLGKRFVESFRSGGGWNHRSPAVARDEERDEVGRKE
jgi:hypothetical protein